MPGADGPPVSPGNTHKHTLHILSSQAPLFVYQRDLTALIITVQWSAWQFFTDTHCLHPISKPILSIFHGFISNYSSMTYHFSLSLCHKHRATQEKKDHPERKETWYVFILHFCLYRQFSCTNVASDLINNLIDIRLCFTGTSWSSGADRISRASRCEGRCF